MAESAPAPRIPSRIERWANQDPAEAQRRYEKVLERRLTKARKAVIRHDKDWVSAVEKALGLRANNLERAAGDSFRKWMRSDPESAHFLLERVWGSRSKVDVQGFKKAVSGKIPTNFQDVLLPMLLGSKAPSQLRLEHRKDGPALLPHRNLSADDELAGPPTEPAEAGRTRVHPSALPSDTVDIDADHPETSSVSAPLTLPTQEAAAMGAAAPYLDQIHTGGLRSSVGSRIISIEAHVAETFQSHPAAKPSASERREAALVHRYVAWLARLGKRAVRNEIRPPGCERPLYTDLYDLSTGELVEAKASSSRLHIRMAIGQLLDYRRFVDHSRLAILTPSMPDHDLLDLLNSLQIGSIYEVQGGVFDRTTPQ